MQRLLEIALDDVCVRSGLSGLSWPSEAFAQATCRRAAESVLRQIVLQGSRKERRWIRKNLPTFLRFGFRVSRSISDLRLRSYEGFVVVLANACAASLPSILSLEKVSDDAKDNLFRAIAVTVADLVIEAPRLVDEELPESCRQICKELALVFGPKELASASKPQETAFTVSRVVAGVVGGAGTGGVVASGLISHLNSFDLLVEAVSALVATAAAGTGTRILGGKREGYVPVKILADVATCEMVELWIVAFSGWPGAGQQNYTLRRRMHDELRFDLLPVVRQSGDQELAANLTLAALLIGRELNGPIRSEGELVLDEMLHDILIMVRITRDVINREMELAQVAASAEDRGREAV